MRRSCSVALLLSLVPLACSFGRLKEQTEQLRGQWVLIGFIDYDAEPTGDLVAVVYEQTAAGPSVFSTRSVPWSLKEFVLLLEAGERDYRAAVFHDANRNRVIDDGERVMLAEQGNRLRFSGVTTWLRVELSAADARPLPDGLPRDLSGLPPESAQPYYVAMGAVADLQQARFSLEASELGFWEPHSFMRRHGIGVYMLQPYDPDKIPVLLVSGANGNVHNWDYFLQRLDRTRYQPWYYLYPSGMRIFRLGEVLNNLFTATVKTHDVPEVVVLAHSMGGLVAREFIRRQLKTESPTTIRQLFTISTPWAGHSSAASGVELLSTPISKPIPSWLDLSAGSRFLQGVFAEPIGERVDCYLLFGYTPGVAGDGVIELDSQLLPEAQDEATAIRGYRAGHVAILSRDDVFEYVSSHLVAPGATPE